MADRLLCFVARLVKAASPERTNSTLFRRARGRQCGSSASIKGMEPCAIFAPHSAHCAVRSFRNTTREGKALYGAEEKIYQDNLTRNPEIRRQIKAEVQKQVEGGFAPRFPPWAGAPSPDSQTSPAATPALKRTHRKQAQSGRSSSRRTLGTQSVAPAKASSAASVVSIIHRLVFLAFILNLPPSAPSVERNLINVA
jgi:hypothetical protein